MLLQVDQEGVRGIEVSDLGGSRVEDHHVDLSPGLDACSGGLDRPRYVWAGTRPVGTRRNGFLPKKIKQNCHLEERKIEEACRHEAATAIAMPEKEVLQIALSHFREAL